MVKTTNKIRVYVIHTLPVELLAKLLRQELESNEDRFEFLATLAKASRTMD
jgi:hypothetical protein